jgi:hypothetical protein
MMSSRPSLRSSATSCGRSVLCPAASELMPDDVHVVLDGLARGLLRGLEQRTHVHIEAQVGVGRGHHLGAAVVAVLAHLGDHDARPPPLARRERLDHRLHACTAPSSPYSAP